MFPTHSSRKYIDLVICGRIKLNNWYVLIIDTTMHVVIKTTMMMMTIDWSIACLIDYHDDHDDDDDDDDDHNDWL